MHNRRYVSVEKNIKTSNEPESTQEWIFVPNCNHLTTLDNEPGALWEPIRPQQYLGLLPRNWERRTSRSVLLRQDAPQGSHPPWGRKMLTKEKYERENHLKRQDKHGDTNEILDWNQPCFPPSKGSNIKAVNCTKFNHNQSTQFGQNILQQKKMSELFDIVEPHLWEPTAVWQKKASRRSWTLLAVCNSPSQLTISYFRGRKDIDKHLHFCWWE